VNDIAPQTLNDLHGALVDHLAELAAHPEGAPDPPRGPILTSAAMLELLETIRGLGAAS
jgi:hypothetical protein